MACWRCGLHQAQRCTCGYGLAPLYKNMRARKLLTTAQRTAPRLALEQQGFNTPIREILPPLRGNVPVPCFAKISVTSKDNTADTAGKAASRWLRLRS